VVVLEKSEAGSRCITNGFFVESKPNLGGTTDAYSIRPIWDECCFYLIEIGAWFNIDWRRYVCHRFSSSLKDLLIHDSRTGNRKDSDF
jgi:hypothetical protein